MIAMQTPTAKTFPHFQLYEMQCPTPTEKLLLGKTSNQDENDQIQYV